MKAKKNRIFAILIAVFYFITLLVYIIALSVEYSNGQKNVDKTFSSLTAGISDIIHHAEPDSYAFVEEINNSQILHHYIDDNTNLATLQMSVNDELIFSSPKDISKSPTARSSLVVYKTTYLDSEKGAAVKITAAIYLLRPSSIYNYGKIVFFVILVLTLAAALTLIAAYTKGETPDYPEEKKQKKSDEVSEVEQIVKFERQLEEALPSGDDKDRTILYESLNETDDFAQEESEPQNPQEEDQPELLLENDPIQSQPQTVASDDDYVSLEEQLNLSSREEDQKSEVILEYDDGRPSRDELFSDADIIDVTKEFFDDSDDQTEEEAPKLTFVDETPELTESKKEEQGLFSPETGFGWESYMLPRLDGELVRAASTEQDLSLFAIEIPEFRTKEESLKQICQLVLDTVKFQDLVFEMGKTGCTAIFPGLNIDQSLEMAEQLHTSIMYILSKNNISVDTFVGISSKSSRLISGERLLNEAKQALEHTDKESPIVAFRVNPEKYRNYLSEASKNQD